jgi:UDP:flavonoid glycosyltransferase YjiC (YdhE family)
MGEPELLPMGSLESTPLRQAVLKMMSDEDAKSRSRQFAGSLKEKNGPSHAADLGERRA